MQISELMTDIRWAIERAPPDWDKLARRASRAWQEGDLACLVKIVSKALGLDSRGRPRACDKWRGELISIYERLTGKLYRWG